MAGSWAGAYGAGGASEELHRLLSERMKKRMVDEDERRARADETFRQSESAAAREREARRETIEREDATERKRQFDTSQKQHADDVRERRITHDMDSQKRSMERADDREAGLADREDEQAFRREERRSAQEFQRSLINARSAPSEKDRLETERARLALEAEKTKQAEAGKERERQTEQSKESTQAAYESVNRLLDPKGVGGGLDSSYGAYEMRGRLQPAQDFKAERDKLVAMLALPNMGMLKGPMSDKDLLFIKQISSNLANDNISESAARSELGRLKAFLESRGAVPQGNTANLPAVGQEGVVNGVPAVWDGRGWLPKGGR